MKILIVDDNSDDRSMLRCALEAHGHEVVEAVNGQAGLQTASEHRFDLIISDGLMPVMDGFQFLRALRASSSLPFIFYSAAYDSNKDKQLALSLGANGYLVKPLDPLELLEEIGRILSKTPQERTGPLQEDAEYLKSYSQVVVAKLEDKVRELETSLAERKRAEQAVRKSELRLTEAQRIAHLGNWELDLSNNTLFWSDEIYRIFEIEREQFGASYDAFLDAIHPDDRKIVHHAYTESVSNHTPYCIIHRLLMKDGRIKYVEEHCETSYDEDDRPLLSVGTVYDITERMQAEQRLYEKQQKLTEMAMELSLAEERERQRIAAELHDHLSQSLLLGKIKLRSLIGSRSTANIRPMLEEMLELQDRMIRSVRSLTQQLSPPILSVAGLEDALCWLAERMQEDYGLQVQVVDDTQPKPLTDDMRAIVFQACRELLINVAKHAQTKTARVIVGREGDCLSLTVEDQGVGFDLSGSTVNGFGLFSISERINYLGGNLLIESAPGQGTQVSLRVALAVKQE